MSNGTEELVEVTREMMSMAATSPCGEGYINKQLEVLRSAGIDGGSKGWLKRMVGTCVPRSVWDRFVLAGNAKREKNYRAAGLDPANGPVRLHHLAAVDSIHKTPTTSRPPEPPHPAEFKRSLPETKFVDPAAKRRFFDSADWKFMRSYVLRRDNYTRQHCRATGVRMHVDHKIPLTVDWTRRLDLLNLQALCEDCNVGKSNLFVG